MPHYVLSLVDALRAVRAEHRMHMLSYAHAPAGKAATCLACGLVFDDYRDAGGECAGEHATCGMEPVPGAQPVSVLPMLERCFRHQHPESFGRAAVPGVTMPVELRDGRDAVRETPKVYDAPSDRGIAGAYALPADALGGM